MHPSVGKRIRALGALAVVVALFGLAAVTHTAGQAAAPATPAASAPAITVGQLVMVNVKPEAWDEYVTLQKTEMMPALQKAGIERRRAWRPHGLGRAFEVAYLYPLKSYGALDETPPLERAMGADGAKAFNARLRKLLTSVRYAAYRTRADLSYGLDGAVPKMGVLARVLTVAGRQFEFEGFLKTQWGPALKKAGVPMYVVQEIVLGGEMGEYYTFTPIDKFAALDAGHPIMRALGQPEYQSLIGKMGPSIRSVERSVIKLDEELSFDTTKTTSTR